MGSTMLLIFVRRGIAAMMIALGLTGAVSAQTAISFFALPLALTGAAGSTVGWGYEITNSSANFYVPTALNADVFQWALPLSLLDFPVLAPEATVTQNFVSGVAGLYQLTWDTDAPIGFVNDGVFVLSGEFYSSDPLAGGTLLSVAPDAVANYSAMLQTTTAVPEPSVLLMSISGLCLMLAVTRKQRHLAG